MTRVFRYTPEETSIFVTELEARLGETRPNVPKYASIIDAYARELVGNGFSMAALESFGPSLFQYTSVHTFGELTPDDISALGFLQGRLYALLKTD